MTIEAAGYRVTHPDRHLACQEAVEPTCWRLSTKRIWGLGYGRDDGRDRRGDETLRLAYAEDPDPAEEPIMDARLFLHKHPTDEG